MKKKAKKKTQPKATKHNKVATKTIEPAQKSKVSDWFYIGQVAVESGTIWISDPCYVGKMLEDREKLSKQKGEKRTGAQQYKSGMGLSVFSSLGDGMYQVQAKTIDHPTLGKHTKEIRVVFLSDGLADGTSDYI
jgi:hypothetical protein